MKNIVSLLLAAFLTVGASFAYIDTNQMTNEVYLKNQNYSDEAVRLINLTKFDPYVRPVEEASVSTKFEHAIEKMRIYFDPSADSQEFGLHKIYYYNKWDSI